MTPGLVNVAAVCNQDKSARPWSYTPSIPGQAHILAYRDLCSVVRYGLAAYLLHQPLTSTLFASRAFSVAAPAVWNELSVSTQTASSVGLFKSILGLKQFISA